MAPWGSGGLPCHAEHTPLQLLRCAQGASLARQLPHGMPQTACVPSAEPGAQSQPSACQGTAGGLTYSDKLP